MSHYFFTFVVLCLLTASVFAAEPGRIPDPGKFSEEILDDVAQNRISDVAKKITDVAGKPEQKPALESGLRVLEGKKVEYRKKVIDKDYAGALRQIVYYTFISDLGFVYFRFNYKQTGTGWVLAHFNYTAEANELFPPALNIE